MTEVSTEQYVGNESIGELIQSNDMTQISAILSAAPPAEIARMISSLNKPDQIRLA